MTGEPEYLDLTQHDFEDMAGKLVKLHGRDYVLYKRLGEGGEGTVFALLNTKSQVATLAGKVYHCLKGSPEYDETLSNISRVMFALGAGGDDAEPKRIVPESLCEAAGGLIGIQECLNPPETDMSFIDLVKQSAALLRKKDLPAAIGVCDRILQRNPCHIFALTNKASAFAAMGEMPESISTLQQAVEIEPNDPRLTRILARYWSHLGRGEIALDYLKRSLARWRWDGWTWKLLARIATEWDMTDSVVQELEYGLAALPDRLGKLRAEVAASASRREQYETNLNRGIAAQHDGDWTDALAILQNAQAISRNNGLAILNAQVCRYNLQRWAEIEEYSAVAIHGPTGAQRLAATVISLVGLVRLGNIEAARDLALYIAEVAENPIDLPRIPVVVLKDAIVESLPLDDIVSAIHAIADAPTIGAEEAQSMKQLLDRYVELERMTTKGNA